MEKKKSEMKMFGWVKWGALSTLEIVIGGDGEGDIRLKSIKIKQKQN